MTTFQTTAKLFADAFESRVTDHETTRGEFPRRYFLKDGSPEWMTDAIREAHNGRLPDDWTYEHCSHIVDRIAECEDAESVDSCEIADSLVDIYTSALTAWLASHLDNVSACDEAVSEGLIEGDAPMDRRIAIGQYIVLDRMCAALVYAIENAPDDDTSDPADEIIEGNAVEALIELGEIES